MVFWVVILFLDYLYLNILLCDEINFLIVKGIGFMIFIGSIMLIDFFIIEF